MQHILAEYIWMDGGSESNPVQHLRSKTRVIEGQDPRTVIEETFPVWSFDGSSTNQSAGSNSDLMLKPVRHVPDPIRGEGCYLVLCEVMEGDGKTPHSSNTRAKLRDVLEKGAKDHEPWLGFEQEYVLYKGRHPLGWPDSGYPSPQGPYYCGVGADEVAGRKVVEAHLRACLEAGVMIYGVNAEVMLGQWEFQIGHRGFEDEVGSALEVADHLWLARWILYRIGEEYGVAATLDCKPEKGDWNGSGMHTNFSTKAMRAKETGAQTIETAINKLGAYETPKAHIREYGYGLEDRLTGHHETCSINEFKSGVSDRTASIRVPRHVHEQGYGYIEDRRPGANADPYRVAARLLETICLD